MPTQIVFYDKATGDRADLKQIDDDMREYFNQPPSDSEWLGGWMDSIGLRIALGWKLDEDRMIEALAPYEGLSLIREYLVGRFTTDAYKCWK